MGWPILAEAVARAPHEAIEQLDVGQVIEAFIGQILGDIDAAERAERGNQPPTRQRLVAVPCVIKRQVQA